MNPILDRIGKYLSHPNTDIYKEFIKDIRTTIKDMYENKCELSVKPYHKCIEVLLIPICESLGYNVKKLVISMMKRIFYDILTDESSVGTHIYLKVYK